MKQASISGNHPRLGLRALFTALLLCYCSSSEGRCHRLALFAGPSCEYRIRTLVDGVETDSERRVTFADRGATIIAEIDLDPLETRFLSGEGYGRDTFPCNSKSDQFSIAQITPTHFASTLNDS
jgi:hypothetical protein